ncbi:hypothetical protein HDK90DRAFT_119669 [Phyllosticta capitalensis]|uniref:Secreted protein n=1 Tax=Phyllosticta capitalensis TaxID=121624 RepID=A0ABR1Y8L3_9PEZI
MAAWSDTFAWACFLLCIGSDCIVWLHVLAYCIVATESVGDAPNFHHQGLQIHLHTCCSWELPLPLSSPCSAKKKTGAKSQS